MKLSQLQTEPRNSRAFRFGEGSQRPLSPCAFSAAPPSLEDPRSCWHRERVNFPMPERIVSSSSFPNPPGGTYTVKFLRRQAESRSPPISRFRPASRQRFRFPRLLDRTGKPLCFRFNLVRKIKAEGKRVNRNVAETLCKNVDECGKASAIRSLALVICTVALRLNTFFA